MKYTIRKVEIIKDKNFVKEIFSEYRGEEMSMSEVNNRLNYIDISDNDDLYICQTSNNIKVGIICLRRRENIEEDSCYLEVSLIVVSEKFRNRGIGKILIEFAEEMAKSSNLKGLWLVSGFGREEQAHFFYKSIGFKINGYRFVNNF